MLLKNYKRILSFVLALGLSLSLIPTSALATSEDFSGQTHPATETNISETVAETTVSTGSSEPDSELKEPNNEVVDEIQARINAILNQYGITSEMSDQEIGNAIIPKDGNTIKATMEEMTAIEDTAWTLTEDELAMLDTDLYSRFCSVMEQLYYPVPVTTVEVLDGDISITDTANSNKVSNGVVTVTVKGNIINKKTNTVTITNETDNTATVSFDYSVTKANSFTIDAESKATSGSYSKLLNPGASITITLTSNSGLSNLTATLTLKNFSLTVAANSSKVIFEYDSDLGSITMDSSAVSSGEEKDVPLSGAALSATAKSGATFYGWINEEGLILSTSATYTLTPASNMTVKAVFLNANSAPHFYVGAAAKKTENVGITILYPITIEYYQVSETYLFDDLSKATAFANTTNNKYVVPANSGTLAAGDYTIPAGVTLLIPFDSANTLYTTKTQSDGTYVTPTAYRTLTLSDGVNLTVNGAISVSAKTRYANGSALDGGSPSGPAGFINMLGSSNITVNNGGALYVYGFITGSGRVTAKSGATVYECFQFMDCRGGTQMTGMEHDVFPLSQYYVQNIEVPLRIEEGASEYAFTTVYMSSTEFPAEACFIGPNAGMFRMTNGYVEKHYDGSTDRLIINMAGNGTLSSIALDVGATEVNSDEYDLAINSNITVNIKSGSKATIQQDMVLLPGGEIYIEHGAECTLGSGKQIFIYDADTWGNYCYSKVSKPLAPLTYAPSKNYTRTEADLVDARVVVDGYVDVSEGYAYTTYKDDEGIYGANICSTGTGVIKTKGNRESNVTHNYQLDQTNKTYAEIPVEPIKLQNADGSYVETAKEGAGTYTYLNGFWHKAPCDGTTKENTTATCTEAGEKTVKCGCGVINTKENDPALGHSYGDWTPKTPATLDSAAVEERICGRCSDVDTRTLNSASIGSQEYETLADALSEAGAGATVTLLTDITGKTTVSQQVTIQIGSFSVDIQAGEGFTYAKNGTVITIGKAVLGIGAVNLRAGDSLDLFFYVKKTALANSGYTDFYAKIERTKGGTVQPAETISYAQWEDYNETYVRFCYDGIAAKEMTDSVTVTVYSADGKPLSSAYTDSVQGYAMRMIRKGSSSAALKTALVDMLNYGAAAQTHFGFNTSSPANALIEIEGYSSLATKETPVCTKITGNPDAFYAGSVSVKNNLTFTFCFSGIDPYKIATATYTDHYGKNKTPSGTFYTLTDENGVTVTNGGQTVYGVDIEDIAIADGRQKITCTVTDVSGNEIQAISSVESYLAYAMEKYPDEDVFPMLAKFIDSAYAYFHQ